MSKPTFPDFVPPMMAESAKAPFDSPDWIFEIKGSVHETKNIPLTEYFPFRARTPKMPLERV
jgi:hypothetical protein